MDIDAEMTQAFDPWNIISEQVHVLKLVSIFKMTKNIVILISTFLLLSLFLLQKCTSIDLLTKVIFNLLVCTFKTN